MAGYATNAESKVLTRPKRPHVAPVEHQKELPYADLSRFMAALRSRDSLSAPGALRLFGHEALALAESERK